MFQLSLVDHLRLTFGHVVYRQRAHSQLARTLSSSSRRLRATEQGRSPMGNHDAVWIYDRR